MIWIAIAAALVLAAGILFLARTTRSRLIIAVAGVAAIGGYWFMGKPGMPDEPLSSRVQTLETEFKKAPESLTPEQILAVAQRSAQERPKEPGPHVAMGVIFEQAGRPNEAIMAYQAALRRDPNFVPAMTRLADLLFKMSEGKFDAPMTQLYHRAFELDPTDLRIGYFAAVGDWQAGKKAEAEAQFAKIEAQTADGDPRRQMFKAMREAFASDKPPAEPPSQTPAKTPG